MIQSILSVRSHDLTPSGDNIVVLFKLRSLFTSCGTISLGGKVHQELAVTVAEYSHTIDKSINTGSIIGRSTILSIWFFLTKIYLEVKVYFFCIPVRDHS